MSTYNIEQGSVFSTNENCHIAWQLKKQKQESKTELDQFESVILLENIYTARLQVALATNPNT